MTNREIIVGGPGCGKTTALVNRMERELKKHSPEEVAFLGFTRKAAYEAKDRVCTSMNLESEELPYCKTIHSLAFHALGLTSQEIMDKKDYAQLGQEIGLDFNAQIDDDYGLPLGASNGEKLSRLEQFCRVSGKDLMKLSAECGINPWKARHYQESLSAFKSSRGLVDFTDMIDRFIHEQPIPAIPVVFIDEAQDLSPVHWKAMNYLMNRAETVYIGGDDDQTIFQWAGADVRYFLSMTGTRTILPVSHRLPKKVFNLASAVSKRIQNRIAKDWRPVQKDGGIYRVDSPDVLPLSTGEWLLLGRHSYQLREYVAICRRFGYPYEHNGFSSTDTPYVTILISWEELKRGKPISSDKLRAIMKYANKDVLDKSALQTLCGNERKITLDLARDNGLHRFDLNWYEALSIPIKEANYYRECMKRFKASGSGSLTKAMKSKPRIKLSTIHGVKGGEADNVAIIPDLSKSAYIEYSNKRTSDNETRVFYVGVTRAKDSLWLIHPKTEKYFQL